MNDVPAALSVAGGWLREAQKLQPTAVGHRVVHGGPKYDQPILIDAAVLARTRALRPAGAAASAAQSRRRAGAPRALSRTCRRSPASILLSTAVTAQLPIISPCRKVSTRRAFAATASTASPMNISPIACRRSRRKSPTARVIVAHLGSGASMCALRDGRSVDSTMGFTALDGLPMGTRPGQIDPGVVLYLIMQKGMDPAAVQDLLYRESGLKGLSGISNDMRELQSNEEPRAKLAVDYFVHRAGLCTGMLAAALGGLDAFVFTAGIGENSPVIRAASPRSSLGLASNWTMTPMPREGR